MKRLIAFILTLVCVLGLVGCSAQKDYAVRIVVPAGNQGEFVYSEEEISPRKSQLDIKSIDMSEDAEFVLKPIEEKQEKKSRSFNNILAIFGILAVFSIICDVLQLVDWFSENGDSILQKFASELPTWGDIGYLVVTLLIPLVLLIMGVYAIVAFIKNNSKK
jgi:hypothetical protein